MARLQGKKRLLEQSNKADAGFQLDDGAVDGDALANKSRLALVVQDAGDLVEARLLHEEVTQCQQALATLPTCEPFANFCEQLPYSDHDGTSQVIAGRAAQLGPRHMDTLQVLGCTPWCSLLRVV